MSTVLAVLAAYQRALADSERMLGPGDIETLTTRCNLASAYYIVGRLADVVAVLQRAGQLNWSGRIFSQMGLRACGGGAKRRKVGHIPRSGLETAAGRAM